MENDPIQQNYKIIKKLAQILDKPNPDINEFNQWMDKLNFICLRGKALTVVGNLILKATIFKYPSHLK